MSSIDWLMVCLPLVIVVITGAYAMRNATRWTMAPWSTTRTSMSLPWK